MRAEDLTKTLDLTVVEPDMTEEDLERFCAEARDHHFAALCSHPRFVPRMAELLKGCDVKSCAVIDFPGGRLDAANGRSRPTARWPRVPTRSTWS